MLLCVGCSSTLSDSAGPSAPTNSEKPGPPILYYGCGHHALCSRCQVMHRRLAKGCIMCESVSDLLGGGNARASAKGGLPGYSESGGSRSTSQTMDEDTGDFVLGDDDEEDEALPPADARASPPPSYEGGLAPVKDEKGREQVSLHYLRPEDTLNGLALKYGVEGRLLCHMNKLPTSTLYTTPHLLHTLPFLLLPPSAVSSSTEPIHPPEVERRRLIVRRFQVRCRCADWAMAQAYVDAVFTERGKEAEMIRTNRLARGDPSAAEVVPREGGELEEAVASYERDEKWEKQQKGSMGSRLKSTGKVEGAVKGWSWPR